MVRLRKLNTNKVELSTIGLYLNFLIYVTNIYVVLFMLCYIDIIYAFDRLLFLALLGLHIVYNWNATLVSFKLLK